MKLRTFVVLIVGLVLAAPGSAYAHARTTTVAIDYRLVLDRASKSLPGVSVSILDGDRSLHVHVRRGTLVVRGDLGEPMLRITPHGAWVNRASTTAVAEKLATPGRGWRQLTGGSSFAWHEHRLGPPPYADGRPGPVARFVIPATLDGRSVTIGGSFVRYRRPPLWPWALAAGIAVAALAAALRVRPRWRAQAATVLGSLAGLAALATLVVFGAADAPNGRVAWAQIAVGVVLAGVLYGALIRLDGLRRVHLAGLLGVAAGAVSLGSLGVFLHGVVISLLSATASRLLLAIALVAGAAAAVSSFTVDEPARSPHARKGRR